MANYGDLEFLLTQLLEEFTHEVGHLFSEQESQIISFSLQDYSLVNSTRVSLRQDRSKSQA